MDMKKQINDLLFDMHSGQSCIGETADKLLQLFEDGGHTKLVRGRELKTRVWYCHAIYGHIFQFNGSYGNWSHSGFGDDGEWKNNGIGVSLNENYVEVANDQVKNFITRK